MEEMNETKQITATYEDALRYIDRLAVESFGKMREMSEGRGFEGFLIAMMAQSEQVSASVEAVAFCYGVPASKVLSDLMGLKDGE